MQLLAKSLSSIAPGGLNIFTFMGDLAILLGFFSLFKTSFLSQPNKVPDIKAPNVTFNKFLFFYQL